MFFRKRLKKYDKEKEEKLRNDIESDGGLEKNDVKAMILAALTTIVPVCLAVLLALAFLTLWIFGLL